MSKNVRSLSTTELRKQLALYRSLKSRGVYDEIMISIMEHELEARKELESA
jgi:hypothetical protein